MRQFFIISLIFLLGLGVFFLGLKIPVAKTLKFSASSSEKKALDVLIAGAKKIQERFEKGDFEQNFLKQKYNCPFEIGNLENVGSEYLRCNANFLQCFLQGGTGHDRSFTVKASDGKDYHVLVNPIFKSPARYLKKDRYYEIVTRNQKEGAFIPSYAVQLNISIQEKTNWSLNILLENTCATTYLPQAFYTDFDTFHQDIYVDKFLVTWRDIIEWIDYSKTSLYITPPKNRTDWSAPATGLNFDQMQKYCAFRGKQILPSHIFKAASLYREKENLGKIYPSVYPWTAINYKSFIEKIKKGQPSENFINSENCSLVYSSDCLKYPPSHYSNASTSWIGMNEVLGGSLEAFANPFNPDENLKLSSLYFPWESGMHSVGKVGTWNKKDTDRKSISVELPQSIESLTIGFRCYEMLAGEDL